MPDPHATASTTAPHQITSIWGNTYVHENYGQPTVGVLFVDGVAYSSDPTIVGSYQGLERYRVEPVDQVPADYRTAAATAHEADPRVLVPAWRCIHSPQHGNSRDDHGVWFVDGSAYLPADDHRLVWFESHPDYAIGSATPAALQAYHAAVAELREHGHAKHGHTAVAEADAASTTAGPACLVCGTTNPHKLMRCNADPPHDLMCTKDFLAAMAMLGTPDSTEFCTRCGSRAVVAIGTLATAHDQHARLPRACRPCLTAAITDLATAQRLERTSHVTNALHYRRITVPSSVTHAGHAADMGTPPIWFLGGVGYCTLDHPALERYLNAPDVRVEPVEAPPSAYLQAIEDLPEQDRTRGQVDPPTQGGEQPHHFQGPHL